jgi:hypothetical protein
MLVAVNVGYRAAKWVDEGRLRVTNAGSGQCRLPRRKSTSEGLERVMAVN